MSEPRISRNRAGRLHLAPGRWGLASLLVPVFLLGTPATAQAAPGAEEILTPAAAPAVGAAPRPLALNLDRLLNEPRAGHAEFNLALRHAAWEDPMVRLAFGLEREEAAARRGGMVGAPVRLTATAPWVALPGADLRLVLAGPFASDWSELSPSERLGRITETVVTYGIIFEVLRGSGRHHR